MNSCSSDMKSTPDDSMVVNGLDTVRVLPSSWRCVSVGRESVDRHEVAQSRHDVRVVDTRRADGDAAQIARISLLLTTVLARYFGGHTSFTVTSDSPAMAGVSRTFSSFSAALDEVANARAFGGIHFRAGCVEGQFLGAAVGDYVWNHAFQRVSAADNGQAN
jgi:hypothetical protein